MTFLKNSFDQSVNILFVFHIGSITKMMHTDFKRDKRLKKNLERRILKQILIRPSIKFFVFPPLPFRSGFLLIFFIQICPFYASQNPHLAFFILRANLA